MMFKRTLLGALSAASLLALPGPALADTGFSLAVTAYKQAVAEALSENEGMAAFYRARNFEPLWTVPDAASAARRSALIEAFSLAKAHGLPADKYDAQAVMQRLAQAKTGRDRGALEVELTELFLSFANDLQSGILSPNRVVSDVKRKAPRRAPQELLSLIEQTDPRAVLRSIVPSSPEYTRLLRAKMTLEHRIASGGWGPTVPQRKLQPGDSGPSVVALRNRLIKMGYMPAHLGATYDTRMQSAVLAFQQDHGLEADGIAGGATIAELNVSPLERLKSVIVAMERERWLNLPDGLGKRHIKVNLTDFHAQIIDDGKLTFETRSVIGHQDPDRRTPEFSDVMEHMVINPSWYVPRSIIVKEYLPLLRSNPGAVGHLDIIDSRGRVVGRGNGFSQYSASSFPFSMRQPPGPRNALGTVKFMFPNKYNIYLHDTQAKNLFSKEVRTYSHGCVRLNDPHDFAYALLAKQEADPEGFFQSILRSREERRVDLVEDVPVHLIYRTAFTPAKGPVNYRRDVYGRDARIWSALSNAGVALPAADS